jgi:DNA integrity scanning protein DisA with diadenylate cyclase activity
VGGSGLLRWDGFEWRLVPPMRDWFSELVGPGFDGEPKVLKAMLAFAVHDLGALGIGALLVYRAGENAGQPGLEERLPTPPPLDVRKAYHLAPLRHSLSQVDGAAIFDRAGVLRHLGVRLVPSPEAERAVEAFGGTRHISGLRYSYDDPAATVIAVSEDGPVSVLRQGMVLSRPVGPVGPSER